MNKLWIFLLLSSLAYSSVKGCNNRETEDGGCCVFPFKFGDQWFLSCTTYGWDQEWCSLTPDYDRDGEWGNCKDEPFTVAPPIPTSLPTSGGGDECGIKPMGSSRIVGGVQAQKGEWPWQAMLASKGGSQFCGGSLIADNWVLTASHCVEGTSAGQIVVRMGAHNIRDIGQEVEVAKIIMHESYNSPMTIAHDIALLKLKTNVKKGAGVATVCLPEPINPLIDGKRCYITGWGTLQSGGNQPETLMEASVPIVSETKCKYAYGSSAIHESMICAGLDAGGVDACQGDSGGPMVCEFNNKWYLEGATSWGHGCAAAGKYGVYAKVRYLKSWVMIKMNNN